MHLAASFWYFAAVDTWMLNRADLSGEPWGIGGPLGSDDIAILHLGTEMRATRNHTCPMQTAIIIVNRGGLGPLGIGIVIVNRAAPNEYPTPPRRVCLLANNK